MRLLFCGKFGNVFEVEVRVELVEREIYLFGVEVVIAVVVGDGDDVEVFMGAVL